MKPGTSFDLFVNFGLGGLAVILILFFSLRAKQPSETKRKRARRVLLLLLDGFALLLLLFLFFNPERAHLPPGVLVFIILIGLLNRWDARGQFPALECALIVVVFSGMLALYLVNRALGIL